MGLQIRSTFIVNAGRGGIWDKKCGEVRNVYILTNFSRKNYPIYFLIIFWKILETSIIDDDKSFINAKPLNEKTIFFFDWANIICKMIIDKDLNDWLSSRVINCCTRKHIIFPRSISFPAELYFTRIASKTCQSRNKINCLYF